MKLGMNKKRHAVHLIIKIKRIELQLISKQVILII
jgi:hypothetical protein